MRISCQRKLAYAFGHMHWPRGVCLYRPNWMVYNSCRVEHIMRDLVCIRCSEDLQTLMRMQCSDLRTWSYFLVLKTVYDF